MRRVAALLAAVLCGLGISACGDGAEPGAPRGATLVLDFQPNAVHAGLYAAEARGYFEDEGLDLEIREPSSTADSAKLLEVGSAQFAIMDINDFGIARERGLDVVAIAAIVQRPLASVIAADRDRIRTPADLEDMAIGVTGVPSDDAVLDTVLASGGVAPDAVERQTIGFQAVPLLAAGKLDAATAFWNAEGVDLARQGIPIREFRVDEFGAPQYPELIVATASKTGNEGVACDFTRGLERGYNALGEDPEAALDDLLHSVTALEPESQQAQLNALTAAEAFASSRLSQTATDAWIDWASAHGIIAQPEPLAAAFDPPLCSP
jgi:putative hydroxymethylpyrimidine transport system substrate-binding protein